MKAIDAEYYGYRDEDDGVLEPLEQEHERKGTMNKIKLCLHLILFAGAQSSVSSRQPH